MQHKFFPNRSNINLDTNITFKINTNWYRKLSFHMTVWLKVESMDIFGIGHSRVTIYE